MVNSYLTKHKISRSNLIPKLIVRSSRKTKRAKLNDQIRDAVQPKHVNCIDLIVSHRNNATKIREDEIKEGIDTNPKDMVNNLVQLESLCIELI